MFEAFNAPAVNSNSFEQHIVAEWEHQAAQVTALAKGTHDNCLKQEIGITLRVSSIYL